MPLTRDTITVMQCDHIDAQGYDYAMAAKLSRVAGSINALCSGPGIESFRGAGIESKKIPLTGLSLAVDAVAAAFAGAQVESYHIFTYGSFSKLDIRAGGLMARIKTGFFGSIPGWNGGYILFSVKDILTSSPIAAAVPVLLITSDTGLYDTHRTTYATYLPARADMWVVETGQGLFSVGQAVDVPAGLRGAANSMNWLEMRVEVGKFDWSEAEDTPGHGYHGVMNLNVTNFLSDE